MATVLEVSATVKVVASLTATSPHAGAVIEEFVNNTGGRQWVQGTASGAADRVFRKSGTLIAAATDSYNTLAAGALLDVYAQAIDLDELKGIGVRCVTGSIKIEAPAANFISIFTDATDLLNIALGATFFMDFGAAGIDVTTNAKFDITDLAGGAGSTYELIFWGAQ